MKFKYLRFLTFLIPLSFVLLMFAYKDSFYTILAGITFIFSLLIVLPKLFSNKKISFAKSKKHLQESNHKTDIKIKSVFNFSLRKKEILTFLSVSSLLFIVFFVFTAINNAQLVPNLKNIFLEYYVSLIFSLKQSWFIMAVILLVTILSGSKLIRFENGSNLSSLLRVFNIFKVFILSCITLLLSFVLSLVAVFIVGIIQLNLASIELKNNPNAVGVIYDKNAINSSLKSMTTLPKIIGINGNPTNTILEAFVDGNINSKSVYQQKILNNIPHTFLIPLNINNKPVVLVKNTLIISSIDKATMQTISPTLAHLLLAKYFKNRDLKGNPTISILNRQEYLAIRQDQINKQVAAIEAEAQKWNDYLASMQADANSEQQKIAYDQNIVNSASSDGDTAYNNCISAGYIDFLTGTTINLYSQDQCNSVRDQYTQASTQAQQDISQLNGELQYYNGQISLAQNAVSYFQNNAQAVNDEKNSTPDELGVFNEPNNIKIVLDSTSPKAIDDFLETLVHENLHYQSFVSNDRQFQFSDGQYDGFWEEGLTEYFARKVIYSDLGVHTNEGYPLIVKTVAQMAKKIPESKLQQIYFTKDESGLESTLDSAYGNNFYKDTEPYFEFLSVFPPDRQLKFANDIMTRIGSQPLTASDLYSTDMPSE